MTRAFGDLICKACGETVPRRGFRQVYCAPCSAQKNLERQERWKRSPTRARSDARKKSDVTAKGQRVSAGATRGRLFLLPGEPDLQWSAHVAIPFDWAVSKNHVWTMRAGGHTAMRDEQNAVRELIVQRMKACIEGQPVVQNKVWVSIFVQKPNHRGDAVNVIDVVCDAVKEAIGVDDRWFSLRSVDWEIAKVNPRIFITVGQETWDDALVCSSCGRVQGLECFQKAKHGPLGRSRTCKECSSARRRNLVPDHPQLFAEAAS